MEAKIANDIPEGPEWQYEPKWDGFRCIAFRDAKEVELQSKASQTLTRYFPEIVTALAAVKASQFVLDGELIVPVEGRLSFDDLLQRIHPAASRVELLSRQRPARFIVFDLLVDAKGKSLLTVPLEERRALLESFHARFVAKDSSVELSRATRDLKTARDWLKTMRGQLDGIVAKQLNQPYLSGERAMLKIKTMRSADCVIGGFRYASGKKTVGSLLLGLYDSEGLLNHVGYTSSLPAAERAALTQRLEALVQPPGFTGQAPGGPSRWSTERSAEWQPLKPELVVEVQYDHFTGTRFRHGTKLLRWRPDKAPRQCTADQVEFNGKKSFADLLA
ncbi:MAG: ATP-dependent DNA ligase [Bryobacteraceae bacterium]